MRKQCDAAEENAQTLNTKVAELISQLDICRSQCTQLDQEKDTLQKSLDTVKLEKNALDKNKVELNSTVGFKIFINFVCIFIDISLKILLHSSRLLEIITKNFRRPIINYKNCVTTWKMKSYIYKMSLVEYQKMPT